MRFGGGLSRVLRRTSSLTYLAPTCRFELNTRCRNYQIGSSISSSAMPGLPAANINSAGSVVAIQRGSPASPCEVFPSASRLWARSLPALRIARRRRGTTRAGTHCAYCTRDCWTRWVRVAVRGWSCRHRAIASTPQASQSRASFAVGALRARNLAVLRDGGAILGR